MSNLYNDEDPESTESSSLLKPYAFSVEDLSEIIKMDNHYKLENSNTIISSAIIMEKYGGIQSIADGLKTSLDVGISANDIL
jgi:hypothetical protein